MNVLVLTEDYPNNDGGVTLMYVHTRNLYYHENGIDVDNLSFSAKMPYIIDGIRVLSYESYCKSDKKYDLLIIHAANVRHHYSFLKKHGGQFPKFLFFYHGHEVMRINRDYAPPYDYMKPGIIKTTLQDIYDIYKLKIWRDYIPTIIDKSFFIFVSNWMLDIFSQNIGISAKELNGRYSVTYNSVGKEFETLSYDDTCKKEYDFVTIRANLDGSKYAVDIVNSLANNTPSGRFLVVGKGKLFDHIDKASNICWLNRTLNHEEIVSMLNKSRYALMPTRTDAQGLMMCEMAAFGIPVITSDIPVCHEIFGGFSNVSFINNDNPPSLCSYLDRKTVCDKDTRYYFSNTVYRELDVINSLL